MDTHSVLMQWAEAGSLDDFLAARLGHVRRTGPPSQTDADVMPDTRSGRIRAFRAAKAGDVSATQLPRRKEGMWKAVHLLSPEEVYSLLQDIVDGLAFLVSVCPTILQPR
jgi:hypothetical protein